jgi:ATP phosphoribosyltransferase
MMLVPWLGAGADLQFFRSDRLDVCLVQNYPIALLSHSRLSCVSFVQYSCSPSSNTGIDHHNLFLCFTLYFDLLWGLDGRVFLPASDIPRFVGEGNVDIGITGQDWIEESQMWPRVDEVLKLGFGKCNLQVQVPEHGAIQSVEDLVGKRVATSFPNGGEYFREMDKSVGKERRVTVETTIEHVCGNVEAACALGLAEGVPFL